MAAVTIHSNFGAQLEEICHYLYLFPFYLPWSVGVRSHDIIFLNVEFYNNFFTLLFHPHKRLFSSSSLSAIRMMISMFLRLLMFLLPILIPAFNLSTSAFLMMCSAYRLNKQGDSRQPCRTPFSILNQSVHQLVNQSHIHTSTKNRIMWGDGFVN